MQPPETPNNEQARLQALYETELLFSADEPRFDRITRLAQRLFDVDIALISLVADDIQWFKSRQGLDATQTDRGVSFCGHAILQDDIFVVNNAIEDARFSDNPLVTGEPNIRFYAGAPLRIEQDCDGNEFKLGTLCVIHSQSRTFTAENRQLLRDLADLVELELRQARLQEQLTRAEVAEQRLASVIEGTNIGTWEWNVQTGATVFNERWADIVGYSLAELAPVSIDTWMGLAHPDDLQASNAALQAHFDGTAEFYDVQCRMRHKRGHWVWVHDRGRLVSRSADGQPLWMAGTHADVSAQVQAQQALSQSEARLRALFELAPYGIALNDFETGSFIDINPAVLKPTGYGREEFMALSYWQITPREYAAQEQEQLLSMRETGRYGPFEKEYIRKDGSRYPVLLSGMVVNDPNGRQLIWSIVEDISERKRMEQIKDDFITTVSHELRTPLTALRGALTLVSSGTLGELPGVAANMVAVAEKNSQRLLLLINDLLDMEKLLAGKMVFNLQWHDLNPLIESSLDENLPYANLYQVSLSHDDLTEGAQVSVDASRLQQIMANLLSNAIKFSPTGGQVTVTSQWHGEGIRICVADQGPGIAPEFHDRIFQKFSQADSSDARQRGGTGLGLAITRELVHNMNGEVGFESRPGEGARFFVDLPLARLPAGQALV
ncbi:PAS domain S-box protein [Halopseudomonas sp.]|uniref:PAS domain S-box protein n=1 Tax=Halopseudomonas sp. TaxID=2901191 RepID=UPI00300362E2